MSVKAQVVFEFVIAAMTLFSIIVYSISYLSSSFSLHHDLSKAGDLEAKAMRVSDMLASENAIGIFSGWPVLDVVRMTNLDNACDGDGYFDIIGRLGLNETSTVSKFSRLQIAVTGEDGTTYVSCGRSPAGGAASGYVTRFGYVPGPGPGTGQLALINVTVW